MLNECPFSPLFSLCLFRDGYDLFNGLRKRPVPSGGAWSTPPSFLSPYLLLIFVQISQGIHQIEPFLHWLRLIINTQRPHMQGKSRSLK